MSASRRTPSDPIDIAVSLPALATPTGDPGAWQSSPTFGRALSAGRTVDRLRCGTQHEAGMPDRACPAGVR